MPVDLHGSNVLVRGAPLSFRSSQRRADERFPLVVAARWRSTEEAPWQIGLVEDASLGGVRLGLAAMVPLQPGDPMEIGIPLVGDVNTRVVWVGGASIGLAFEAADDETRDRLARRLSGIAGTSR